VCSCHIAGNGTEAAISLLTRLTSLHLALSPVDEDELQPPLQLQLLGSSAAANAAGGGVSTTSDRAVSGDVIIAKDSVTC
jgi:hypothetical protein